MRSTLTSSHSHFMKIFTRILKHAARMCTLPIAVEIDFVAASLNTYLLYVNDILLLSYIVTTTMYDPPRCVHLLLKISEDPMQEELLV